MSSDGFKTGYTNERGPFDRAVLLITRRSALRRFTAEKQEMHRPLTPPSASRFGSPLSAALAPESPAHRTAPHGVECLTFSSSRRRANAASCGTQAVQTQGQRRLVSRPPRQRDADLVIPPPCSAKPEIPVLFS